MTPSPFSSTSIGMAPGTLLENHGTCTETELDLIMRATSNAGFTTISMWSVLPKEHGVDRVRSLLDDCGLTVRVLEGIGPWMDGPDAVAAGEVDQNFDLASTFGAGIVLASVQSPTLDMGRATEGFAALCERAATRGMRPAIEFIPCRVVPDLATAWEIVRKSGAENGGILVDFMHFHYQPGGPDFDLLREIPGTRIPFVQVCDAPPGPAPAPDDYIHKAVTARALPGEGVVDIDRIIATLAESGAEPYVAYEVFNLELAKQGPGVMAQRLREVADARFG